MFYLSISILCDFKFVLNYSSEGNIVLKLYLNLKKFHLKKIDKLILYNALLKIRQVVPKVVKGVWLGPSLAWFYLNNGFRPKDLK